MRRGYSATATRRLLLPRQLPTLTRLPVNVKPASESEAKQRVRTTSAHVRRPPESAALTHYSVTPATAAESSAYSYSENSENSKNSGKLEEDGEDGRVEREAEENSTPRRASRPRVWTRCATRVVRARVWVRVRWRTGERGSEPTVAQAEAEAKRAALYSTKCHEIESRPVWPSTNRSSRTQLQQPRSCTQTAALAVCAYVSFA